MKLFSGDIKKKIKYEISENKKNFIFALCFLAVINMYGNSIVKKSEKVMAEANAVLNSDVENPKKERGTFRRAILVDYDYGNNTFTYSNGEEFEVKTPISKYKEYYVEKEVIRDELLNQVSYKTYLLDSANSMAYKEFFSKDLLDIKKDNFVFKITPDNIDFFTVKQKMKFICDEYNLTEFQLKVVISVVYHEASWTYDDAYRVTNVILNRTKSKKNYLISRANRTNLYYQVIATNQFQGYVSGAGYDFEKLMSEDKDMVKLNGILDCLLFKLSVIPFDSFKCNGSRSNDWIGATDYIRYTKSGNVYHSLLNQSDLSDENYELPPADEYRYELTREDVMNIVRSMDNINSYTKKRVKYEVSPK